MTRRNTRGPRLLTPAISGCLTILMALAAPAAEYELRRYTIDGGGVMFSAGGNFVLSGTIGQPDAGGMSGGHFELTGGFWFPLESGDCNQDGGVNLVDYGDFQPCLSGPGGGVVAGCNCFDIDQDNDADLADAARFQQAFSGQ